MCLVLLDLGIQDMYILYYVYYQVSQPDLQIFTIFTFKEEKIIYSIKYKE